MQLSSAKIVLPLLPCLIAQALAGSSSHAKHTGSKPAATSTTSHLEHSTSSKQLNPDAAPFYPGRTQVEPIDDSRPSTAGTGTLDSDSHTAAKVSQSDEEVGDSSKEDLPESSQASIYPSAANKRTKARRVRKIKLARRYRALMEAAERQGKERPQISNGRVVVDGRKPVHSQEHEGASDKQPHSPKTPRTEESRAQSEHGEETSPRAPPKSQSKSYVQALKKDKHTTPSHSMKSTKSSSSSEKTSPVSSPGYYGWRMKERGDRGHGSHRSRSPNAPATRRKPWRSEEATVPVEPSRFSLLEKDS